MGDGSVQIGLSGSFTLNELKRELEASLSGSFAIASKVVMGQFNNFPAAMGDANFFESGFIDIEFHLYFLEDVFQNEFERFLSGEATDLNSLLLSIDRAVAALVARARLVNSRIILCLDSKVSLSTFSSINFIQKKRLSSFMAKVNNQIEDQISNSQNIHYFQINDLVKKRELGFNVDWRKEFLFRNPFSLELSKDLAFSLLSIVESAVTPRKVKVLALDCDNTLWGGIIGEDGVGNIQLGNDFPGRAYRKFQHELLNLKNSGYILCLLSKNNLSEVKEVFASHDGMVLKWEDITGYRVNWESKPSNLVNLARELNLGVDSFVFIDDSSKEIAEMRQILPDVKCIQVPFNLEDFPLIFDGFTDLNPLSITVEDSDRSEMMKAEKERVGLSSKFDEAEFLSQLDLELILSVIQPKDLERVSQLVAKTNQFNLTTKRFTSEELNTFVASPHKTAVVGRLRDRFGEYGLIGVIFLDGLSTNLVNVSNFIVSCRALGRDIEMTMLSNSIARCVQDNQAVYIERAPNDRNVPAMNFLEKFELAEDVPLHGGSAIAKYLNLKESHVKIRWAE